jgi:hypothetical protein
LSCHTLHFSLFIQIYIPSLCLSLSFSLFKTSSLPTTYLLLFLFPCLFIYTRQLRYIDPSDEILSSLEIRKCDTLFARRLCSRIINHAYTLSGLCGSYLS